MLLAIIALGCAALIGFAAHRASLCNTPLPWALAGGLLFGMGAAVNGGCSLSTLTRLADGDLGMLAALAGFLAGVSTWIGVQAAGWPAGLAPAVSPWLRWPRLAP